MSCLGQEEFRGVTVVARNLTYTVYNKPERSGKKLLDNVQFCARPGQMVAIMGPSGAGKTMLLNALAGRLRAHSKASRYSGNVYYNGKRNDFSSLRTSGCYVTQEDVLFEHLTVRETLKFAARLRLPTLSKEQLEERIGRVVENLGLENCQNVVVGGVKRKGISGGQKKRLCIGIEMLSDPSLLFLDEPTSGLDSSLAYDVLEVMIKLAREKRTVICTIHQPRSQLFALFDQLVLLSAGQIVYHGPAAYAQQYFASIGHPCPWQFNPADFFLDLVSGTSTYEDTFVKEEKMRRSRETTVQLKSERCNGLSVFQPQLGCTDQQKHQIIGDQALSVSGSAVAAQDENYTAQADQQHSVVQGLAINVMANKSNDHKDEGLIVYPKTSNSSVVLGRVFISEQDIKLLPELFQKSALGNALADAVAKECKSELLSSFPSSPSSPMFPGKESMLCRLPVSLYNAKVYVTKFLTLYQRALLNNVRNPFVTIAQLAVHLSFGLVLGSIFFKLSHNNSDREETEADIRTIIGYIFFVASQFAFANMDTLVAYPKERILFNREAASGVYAPSCYFLAKLLADLPFQHIAPLLFSIVAYFMAGLAPSVGQFLSYCLMGIVCVFASASYFSAIGAATVAFEIANLAAPFGGVLFMLLTGYFVEDSKIPSWIGWIKYINFLRFIYFAFLQNEFRGAERFGTGPGFISNDEALKKLSRIPLHTSMWGNTAICFLIGVGYRLLAFLLLKFFHRKHGVFS